MKRTQERELQKEARYFFVNGEAVEELELLAEKIREFVNTVA